LERKWGKFGSSATEYNHFIAADGKYKRHSTYHDDSANEIDLKHAVFDITAIARVFVHSDVMSEGGTDIFLRAEETDQDSAQALNVNAVVFALAGQYLLLCLDEVRRNLIHFYSLHSFPKNIDVRNINAMAATVHIENRKVLRIGNFAEQWHTNAQHTV